MKRLQSYKAFILVEVTEHDVLVSGGRDSRYVASDVLIFRPGEPRELGYEDHYAGSLQEAKDFVDSDEETLNKCVRSRRKINDDRER